MRSILSALHNQLSQSIRRNICNIQHTCYTLKADQVYTTSSATKCSCGWAGQAGLCQARSGEEGGQHRSELISFSFPFHCYRTTTHHRKSIESSGRGGAFGQRKWFTYNLSADSQWAIREMLSCYVSPGGGGRIIYLSVMS